MMAPWTLLLLCVLNSNPLSIDVWTDKDDAIYYPTEVLTVFFRTNQDCYIAIYDTEVGGSEYRLFPPEGGSGWVQGGRIYQLPPETADYEYVIAGPGGIETIIALASTHRLPSRGDDGPDIVQDVHEIFIKESQPAKLRIVSTPQQCHIYIMELDTGDEEYIGETPRTIVIRPGEYLVTIKKPGFKTMSRRIWLDPGEHRRVFVELMRY
jgi:hypothetical protein